MQLDGGTFTAQRVVAWQGPDMQLDGGTFTADEAAGWTGPNMQLDAGTFSARDSASWTGPDMALDAGTFTITTLVAASWAGPDMQLAGGSWSWSLMGDSYEGAQYVDGALDFSPARRLSTLTRACTQSAETTCCFSMAASLAGRRTLTHT